MKTVILSTGDKGAIQIIEFDLETFFFFWMIAHKIASVRSDKRDEEKNLTFSRLLDMQARAKT